MKPVRRRRLLVSPLKTRLRPPAHTLPARQSDIVLGIMIDGTTHQLPLAQIVLVNQSSQFAAVTIPPDSDALYQPLKRNVSHGLTLESMGANVESTPQPMPAEPGTLKEQEL
ncbi:hypothetical protein ONZ45_g12735 [Pleurotus djamor]|nr:hypothetical protein ONZ45_g12735 [Pleurotus djamor]